MQQYIIQSDVHASSALNLPPAICERSKLVSELPELYELQLPAELRPSEAEFDRLWNMHPVEFHKIKIHGREVATPRWQQAYGADYHYTGRTNRALPLDEPLLNVLEWARRQIDGRLNGILLNWYEPDLDHYIGPHRDSTENLIVGAPIVMLSLGGHRTFRVRPWKGAGFADYAALNGTVLVLPYSTNKSWSHEVAKSTRQQQGRRISITLRAFCRSDSAPNE